MFGPLCLVKRSNSGREGVSPSSPSTVLDDGLEACFDPARSGVGEEDKHPRMSINFISWLIAFVLQSALLGKSMHTMITLTDLEADNINPFDCERLINRFVLAEHVGQAAVTTILLLGRKWLMAAVHLALSAYFVYMYRKNQTYIHANDAFKQLATFKKRRLYIFIVQMVCFVVVAYRLVECAVHTVLTPEGRETVKKLLQESHHFMHY